MSWCLIIVKIFYVDWVTFFPTLFLLQLVVIYEDHRSFLKKNMYGSIINNLNQHNLFISISRWSPHTF